MDTGKAKYLSLQTFSGKIKKIQRSEFTELFERGEYYPPEGATIFSCDGSSTFFVYGGARNSKPGHWTMADRLFQVDTLPVLHQDETVTNSASEVVGFKMYNHSQSRSSQFLKLYGASGVTDACGDNFLSGFTVNGKNLDCPDENSFISNEIQLLEIVSDTTFRSVIIRSGENNIAIENLKSPEVFQDVDIPIPSYGSSMIWLPELDVGSKKVALKLFLVIGIKLMLNFCSHLNLCGKRNPPVKFTFFITTLSIGLSVGRRFMFLVSSPEPSTALPKLASLSTFLEASTFRLKRDIV